MTAKQIIEQLEKDGNTEAVELINLLSYAVIMSLDGKSNHDLQKEGFAQVDIDKMNEAYSVSKVILGVTS